MSDSLSRVEGKEDETTTIPTAKGVGRPNGIALARTYPSALAAAPVVVLLALLLRTGLLNILLVLACSILLLLNPWVRTFLELPSASGQQSTKTKSLSYFDPARFLQIITSNETSDRSNDDQQEAKAINTKYKMKSPLDQSEAYAALRRMPSHLRTPIADLEELIIRDCICTWYNYHSFGEQCLPNQARYSIDHAVGSAYAALEEVRSADVISELMLTAASVMLTILRARRLHPQQATIFSSDTARIEALREAIDRLLICHFKSQDGQCDLLRTLLREILCKQIWNAISGIGEPDFFNRKIVEWGEKQRAKEKADASQDWPEQYARRSSHASGPAASQPPPLPKRGFSTTAATSSPVPKSEPSNQSPKSTRMHLSPMKQSSTPARESSPASPSPARPGSAFAEPLTMQPRAMMMPSLSPAPDHAAFPPRSPISKSFAPPLPNRAPQQPTKTNWDNELNDHRPSIQPPTLPPRKPTNDLEVNEEAWSVLPMDLPSEVYSQQPLPESLQKSMNVPTIAAQDVEGYRLSTDSSRASSENRSFDMNRLSLDTPSRNGQGSTYDSNTYKARSRPTSRPASGASGGIPPAPALAEVLSSTDSPGLAALRDAFEAFLERGGAASRSLFFSPPSAATVAPGEGAALLKLHVGLATMARLVPDESNEEGEVYREDSYNVVVKALQSLSRADDSVAGRPLREALLMAGQRLEVDGDGRMKELLRPVEVTLWTRLQGLYDHFWKETCTRPSGSRPAVASPSLSGITRASEERPRQSMMDQLHYQPRMKASGSAPMSTTNSHGETDETTKQGSTPPEIHEPAPFAQPPALPPAPSQHASVSPSSSKVADKVTRPVPRRAEVQPLTEEEQKAGMISAPSVSTPQSIKQEDTPEATIEIFATDVSPNADRPSSTIVDLSTYEVMIAVEGLVSGGGGFVILRSWKDFTQMDEQLRLSSNLRLPSSKGKTSLTLTRDVEDFLTKLLSTPALLETEAVQHFVNKARAGEPPSNRSGLLMDSLRFSQRGLGLGKSLADGVGVVGKNALNTLQMMPGNVAAMRSTTKSRQPADYSPQKTNRQLVDERSQQRLVAEPDMLEHRRASAPTGASMPPPPPSPFTSSHSPMPSSGQNPPSPPDGLDFSPEDLDNLLSCFFAIADEAFNLSGGWTLRRGLLRVLEQIVRTQYWTSIMGTFQGLAHGLNQEQIGIWLTQVREKFWPDEGKMMTNKADITIKKEEDEDGDDKKSVSIGEDGLEKRAEVAADLLVEAVEEHDEERSAEEKQACHLKAKSIVIAQTPPSSAFLLGPGGKQSCEKALNLLHEEITRPETSLDLVLTAILKLCDIVSR